MYLKFLLSACERLSFKWFWPYINVFIIIILITCKQIKSLLDEMTEKLPDEFNMLEIMGKVEERTPYIVVAFQECERMNMLTSDMRRSLKELDLGLKVSSSSPPPLLYNLCLNIDLWMFSPPT